MIRTAKRRLAKSRASQRGNGDRIAGRYPLPVFDKLKRIAAKVRPEEWKKLPADLTENLDHYLYGTPKK
jgi:hypothetical protein